jgi:hypothetical protein
MSHPALTTAHRETDSLVVQYRCRLLSRTDGIAHNGSFAHLTEEEIAADVVRASTIWKKDQIMN